MQSCHYRCAVCRGQDGRDRDASPSPRTTRWAESLRSPEPYRGEGRRGSQEGQSAEKQLQSAASHASATLQEARLQLQMGQRATTPFGRVRCDPERVVPFLTEQEAAQGRQAQPPRVWTPVCQCL